MRKPSVHAPCELQSSPSHSNFVLSKGMKSMANPSVTVLILTLLVVCCSALSGSGHSSDCAALMEFKAGITSDPSGLLRTWNPTTHCCSWDGVVCDPATGRVANLSRPGLFSGGPDLITDTFMSGSISPSVARLSALRVLDLSNLKQLAGTIPPALGRLPRLTHLLLDLNNLTGPLPAALGRLPRLRRLYLGSNRLSGDIPSSMLASPALSELDLSNNLLSGSIPASVGSLSSLTRLDLHGNKLIGAIPEAIGMLGKLDYLDLSDNQISGSIPPSIGRLTKLRLLYLNQNQLTGSIPDSISGMVSLQFCRLSSNRLTGSLPPSIGALRNMQRLALENNQLDGELPTSIGGLTALDDMYFANNRFSGRIPSTVGNLTNLMTLDLSGNQLSGPLPRSLTRLRRMQDLILSSNPGLSLVSPPSWLGEMGLFKLQLAGTGITGPIPAWLSNSTSLGILDLSSNRLVGKLPHWIGNLKMLSFLNLSNNMLRSRIPEEFRNLTRLMELDLHGNRFTGPLRPVLAKGTQDPIGHYWTLDLSSNGFTGGVDEDIGELEAMDTVERLVLSHNPMLGGRIPESMGKMVKLQEVGMAVCGLSGSIPAAVMNLSSLAVFDVSWNNLTGRIPSHRNELPASGFRGNPGLCGRPLPLCKAVAGPWSNQGTS